MTQRKPTSDTGGIAAIDSGEYTPTIDLKAHHSRGALLFPKTLPVRRPVHITSKLSKIDPWPCYHLTAESNDAELDQVCA